MARFQLFASVAACVFALAGCGDAYSGLSATQGVENVGDAAAVVAHRPTGTQYATVTIGAIDTLGEVLGGLASANDRSGIGRAFCTTFAGTGRSVPALGVTIGWQGTISGRLLPTSAVTTTTAATAVGSTFQGSTDSLAALSHTQLRGCPNSAPPFAIADETNASSFKIALRADYRSGRLASLNVLRATFGEYTMFFTTARNGRVPHIQGSLDDGRTRVASISSDAFGNGSVTITSTGAEYRLHDWNVSD